MYYMLSVGSFGGNTAAAKIFKLSWSNKKWVKWVYIK